MQRYRATSGPFEYVLRFSHEEIDQMCLEALEKAGCLPTSPAANPHRPPHREAFYVEYYL